MAFEPVFGLLNINKPPGLTSHDVVAAVRRGTGVRKVGHAGTLDPLASGVLVLCLGPATRLSAYVMRSPKRYRAEVRLGTATDTYDAEGRVTGEGPWETLTREQIEAALGRFRGEIAQIPPMYSAIRQGGKKLYELARAGQEVTRQPRRVTIYSLTLVRCELPLVTLEVECSPGTYIRSLAHDLGQTLGAGAHLAGLVRLASGAFRLEDAVPLATLQAAMAEGSWRKYLLPPDLALSDLPAVRVDEEQARLIRHGQAIPVPQASGGEARAYDPQGRLLAIVRAADGHWQPSKVFLPES